MRFERGGRNLRALGMPSRPWQVTPSQVPGSRAGVGIAGHAEHRDMERIMRHPGMNGFVVIAAGLSMRHRPRYKGPTLNGITGGHGE